MSDKKYDGLCNTKECLNKAELMPVVELRDEEYSEAFTTVLDLSICEECATEEKAKELTSLPVQKVQLSNIYSHYCGLPVDWAFSGVVWKPIDKEIMKQFKQTKH